MHMVKYIRMSASLQQMKESAAKPCSHRSILPLFLEEGCTGICAMSRLRQDPEIPHEFQFPTTSKERTSSCNALDTKK